MLLCLCNIFIGHDLDAINRFHTSLYRSHSAVIKRFHKNGYFTYFSLYINVCSLLYILNNYDTNSSYGWAFNCTFNNIPVMS